VASKTLSAHGYPAGTSVSAYPRRALVNGGPPTGSAIDTSTVAGDESLTFDGLTEGEGYVAWGAGRPVSFFVEYDGLRSDLADRERIEELERSTSVSLTEDSRVDAHVSFDAEVSPNVQVRIGAGTGSLVDNATDRPMGLKVKFDSADGDEPSTPVQVNLNIVDGTAAGDVHGIVSRIDVNDDSAADGDTVALWGDVFVEADSGRPTWGLNTYVAIETGSGYTEAAVGAEIGVRNNGADVNPGGGIHVVSHGTQDVRFGVLLGGASGEYNVEHSLLLSSSTPPTENHVWIGPLSAGNDPSGTALFKIDAAGLLSAGPLATFGQTLGAGADAVAVQRSSQTYPRAVINTDGRYFGGSGSATPDVSFGRGGSNLFTVGLVASNALEISTAALAGAGTGAFLGLWELSGDASAPAANGARLYLKDNGSGKTQLCARFNSGAVQVLATEP
jgi:hypothetical protein